MESQDSTGLVYTVGAGPGAAKQPALRRSRSRSGQISQAPSHTPLCLITRVHNCLLKSIRTRVMRHGKQRIVRDTTSQIREVAGQVCKISRVDNYVTYSPVRVAFADRRSLRAFLAATSTLRPYSRPLSMAKLMSPLVASCRSPPLRVSFQGLLVVGCSSRWRRASRMR